jgi:hypothetical protein
VLKTTSWWAASTSYPRGQVLKVFNSLQLGLHLIAYAIGSHKATESYRGRLLLMQHNESRPSYLLVGLIEECELRELLDEVYLYALERANEFVRI